MNSSSRHSCYCSCSYYSSSSISYLRFLRCLLLCPRRRRPRRPPHLFRRRRRDDQTSFSLTRTPIGTLPGFPTVRTKACSCCLSTTARPRLTTNSPSRSFPSFQTEATREQDIYPTGLGLENSQTLRSNRTAIVDLSFVLSSCCRKTSPRFSFSRSARLRSVPSTGACASVKSDFASLFSPP